jgi:hypothetical protein
MRSLTTGQRWTVQWLILLNAGATGPIVPSHMPDGWHWMRTFTQKLHGTVGLVGTSVVCLPGDDSPRGGCGPKVEGFAFALELSAL